MTIRDQALDTLRSLKVADIFLEAYQVERLPYNLDVFFGPPEEFFLAPETLAEYTDGVLIPLLDNGNFDTVLFYDPRTAAFVQLSVESPNEDRDTYSSWQQYLCDLFIRLAEADIEDEELDAIAKLVDFHHLDECISFLEAAEGGYWHARRARFIASIQ